MRDYISSLVRKLGLYSSRPLNAGSVDDFVKKCRRTGSKNATIEVKTHIMPEILSYKISLEAKAGKGRGDLRVVYKTPICTDKIVMSKGKNPIYSWENDTEKAAKDCIEELYGKLVATGMRTSDIDKPYHISKSL